MYLHIGSGKNIKKNNIIGIFDMDTATVSTVSRAFIRKMEKKNALEYTDSDIPRSFILTKGEYKTNLKGSERLKNLYFEKKKQNYYIHLSKISTSALRTRLSSESYNDYDVSEEN